MWVLSTNRAELHFFPSPEKVPGGYAALSHVWSKRGDGPAEQSFQDVRRIQEKCARNFTKKGRTPRNHVSEKIRRCCELAEKHGYKWVWIDTCCIDKTSSAELSEAINSMYRYYALAGICYGYLQDVDPVFFSQEDLEKERGSPEPYVHPRYTSFWRSIWFKRGWTLQELIAPRFFVFVSRSWEVIGTKADLAELLEWCCDIPAAVLRLHISPTDFSIAQRMSWFGFRETTRPEDEAYCLLGLFDIHMPPLYGEGRNAFRRLQEEIMKSSADTTLFAWTGHPTNPTYTRCGLFAVSPLDFLSRGIETVYTPPRRTQVPADSVDDDSAASVHEMPGEDVDMTFTVTPTGIRARIPIFAYGGETFGDLYWSSPGQESRVFLRLEHDPDSQASSSRRPSYRVHRVRLCSGGGICPPDGPPTWKKVLIRHRPPLLRAPGQLPDAVTSVSIPAIPLQLTFDAPVRFPEAHIQQFMIDGQFSDLEIHGAGLHSPWTTDPRANLQTSYVLRARNVRGAEVAIITVGQCQQEGPPGKQCRPAAIWATFGVEYAYRPNIRDLEAKISEVSADPLHDCSQDHVLQWPHLCKRFRLDYNAHSTADVTLSFARCPLNPEWTLILNALYHRRK